MEENTVSVEQNKATLVRMYEEVYNKGNLSLAPQLVAPDYHFGELKGPEGWKQAVTSWRTAFPDVHFTIDHAVGEGDWIAYRLSVQGYKDAKLLTSVAFADTLVWYRQMEAMPPGFDQPVARNKAAMYRCFEEVWNKGNLAVIPEVIASDYVGYTAATTTKGLAAFEQTVRNQRAAMPDLHYAVDSVVGEGDTLAIRLTLTGTFTGKMGDNAPTGKRLDFKMPLFNRYVDGKCIESILPGNRLTANQQLGIPEPPR
jgi:predicted ester cyclase